MPLYLQFEKADAERFLRAIESGKAIHNDGPWTRNQILTLAGTCLFAVVSHGPDGERFRRGRGDDPSTDHPERLEAAEASFHSDLHAALDFICSLAIAIQDRHFDEKFEPTVTAAVVGGEPPVVHAIAGFRRRGGVA